MAQRRLSRAFRAFFTSRRESTPAQPQPTPDNLSSPSQHHTEGSSYEEEIQVSPRPSTSPPEPPNQDPPPPPSNPTPPPPPPARITPRPPLPPPRTPAPRDEDTPSSHYSLRAGPNPRPSASLPPAEPTGVETSLPHPEPSPSPLPTDRKSHDASLLRFAGPHRPAPSAGTNSAIAARPELVDVGRLQGADLHTLKAHCQRLGVSTVGAREDVLARLMEKLLEKKPLNEDTMIVDADGVPRTPSRAVNANGGEDMERDSRLGADVVDGKEKAGGLTTTTVGGAGKMAPGVSSGEGVVAKSTEGKTKQSATMSAYGKTGAIVGKSSVDHGPMRLEIPTKGKSTAPFASTNGFPTMSTTGIGVSGDMPQSPAFVPTSNVRPSGGLGSAAFRATPQSAKDGNRAGNPAESVDARGGGRQGMDMPKIFRELAGGSRVLSPAEYDACLRTLSDNVVANTDTGAAALLVSKGMPASAVGKDGSGRCRDGTVADSAATSAKGPVVAKGPGYGRPPQVPPALPGTSEAPILRGNADVTPAHQIATLPVGNKSRFPLEEQGEDSDEVKPGPVGSDRKASDNQGKLVAGEQRRSPLANEVQPTRGKDRRDGEADNASERHVPTAKQTAELHDGGHGGMGQVSGAVEPEGKREGGQDKRFVFNLNTVGDDNRPTERAAKNPFRGAFSGAVGGPGHLNTIGLKANSAAPVTTPAAAQVSPAELSQGPHGDFNIPGSLEKKTHWKSNNGQGGLPRDEQGFATPREILRSFNRYGPDSVPGMDEAQNMAEQGEQEIDQAPETGEGRDVTPSPLPQHLRGFLSMSRPGRGSHRSSLNVAGSASADRVGTLSSFGPRRAVSTASAGIFVNLRNSDLAPENKHMADKLRASGSSNETSLPAQRLPGSSMRILHELKRVRVENRSILSTKRNISPMPVPPSVAKRARLEGAFNASAVRRDAAGSGTDRMQDEDVVSAVPRASPSSQNNQGSSSVYPTTPMRPPTRLKVLPSSTKKRTHTAFGSGRKRSKSSAFSSAAISEMKTLIERKSETNEEPLNVISNDSPPSLKPPIEGSGQPGSDDKEQSPGKIPTPVAFGLSRQTPEQSKRRGARSEIANTTSKRTLGAISGKRKAASVTSDEDAFVSSPVDKEGHDPEHPGTVDGGPISKKKRLFVQTPPDDAIAPATLKKRRLSVQAPPDDAIGAVSTDSNAAIPSGSAENSLKRVSFGNITDNPAQPAKFSFGETPPPPPMGSVTKITAPDKLEPIHKVSKDPSRISLTAIAYDQGSEKTGTPSEDAGPESEAKKDEATKASLSSVIANNTPTKMEQQSGKLSEGLPFETTAAESTPILPFGQPTSSQTSSPKTGLSAYDLFKNQTSKSSPLESTKSTPKDSQSNPAPPLTQAKCSAFTPGLATGAKEAATSGNGVESQEQKTGTSEPISVGETEFGKGTPFVFGTNPQGNKSSSGFSLSFTTAALDASTSAGFSFGPQTGTAEPQSGKQTSADAAIPLTGFSFKAPAEAALTTTKEKTAGSLFAAPKDKLFSGAGNQNENVSKPKSEQWAPVSDQNPASSIFSLTNAATVNMDPAIPAVAPQSTSAKASEVTGTAGIFGASSSSVGAGAAGFVFGSAALGGESKKGQNISDSAPNFSDPFGIKKLSSSAEVKSEGNAFKPATTEKPVTSLFGQARIQSAALSQGAGEVKQPVVFGQAASMPSLGSVGNFKGETEPFPQTSTGFSFGSQNPSIGSQNPSTESFPAGPFRGPQFKPTVGPKPSASSFVFGANSSGQSSGSAAKSLSGNGGNSGTLPNTFTPVPSKPAVSFGNPQATFGGTPSFGKAAISPAPLGQPFGSLSQPGSTSGNFFSQPQPNAAGVNPFGVPQPSFGAPPAQTPPSFGAAQVAIPSPSFGGFGSAGNQQSANPGDSNVMATPSGNQPQFGAGFGKPVFGAPNQGSSAGGFNMGAQQAPSGRRPRKFIRGKRLNR